MGSEQPAGAAMTDADLISAARHNIAPAYAPFSKFETGAVVVGADGSLIPGTIVENVSLGLAMCAERVAMFNAVVGGTRPVTLALAAPDTHGALTWPCGACLQVALELGGADMRIVVGDDDSGPTSSATVGELLPRGPHVEL